MGDLTKDFSRREFKCPCCGVCNINKEFLAKLQHARQIAKIPFRVNSGCRCLTHNKLVGGVYTSDHISVDNGTECSAADIVCYNSNSRYIIIKAALEAGINRIKIYKNFIHLGISTVNPQDIIC